MILRRLFLLPFLLILPFALNAAEPATANSSAFASRLAEYDHPSLGAAKTLAAPVSIPIAHITFDLAAGAVAPLLGSDGTRLGIFFHGKGTYTYHSVDSVETPLVVWEAKRFRRTANEEKDGTVSLTGTFVDLLLLTGGTDLPSFDGPDAAPLGDAFADHQRSFDTVRWTPPSHLLVRQRLDAPELRTALAEIGGDQRAAWILDPLEMQEEQLLVVAPPQRGDPRVRELKGFLDAFPISSQPIGWKHGTFRQPQFLLVDVDFQLVDEGDASMKLSVTETVVPRESPVSAFRFDLIEGEWDTDARLRRLHVDSVRDAGGHDIPFSFDRGSLLVGLPEKVQRGAAAKIRFEISGDVLFRPNNDSFWELGTEPWFPQPGLNGQYYTLHSVVKARKPWIAFVPGTTVSRSEEEKYDVVESRMEHPVQFATVHAGKYVVTKNTEDGLTIEVASYAMGNRDTQERIERLARKIIKFYEPWLGPFPFKEFSIIEIQALGFGQAPPGTMFITREAFNPLQSVENQLYSQGINQRFAHEIAHQYWGHVVKMGSIEEQWLTEAFAEYCSSQVVMQIDGKKGYDHLVTQWRTSAHDAGRYAPVALAARIVNPVDPYQGMRDRIGLMYGKGALILATLHKELGDQKFFTLLRNLQGLYQWRFLTTNDVVALLERIDDGKDYTDFFDKYFWGTEMPK
ncbi:MAG: M1 family aminopeptidase [Thermoanaerobaculia bacterium]